MIGYLRQSTATTILVGPIVDSVDASPEEAQTIAQADVQVWKTGGTTFGSKSEATSCTHRYKGLYTCPLDTTDTGTLGVLKVAVAKTGTLVWSDSWTVLPAIVYDSLVLGADYLNVDMLQISGLSGSATSLSKSAGAILVGTSTNTGFTATSTIFESGSFTEATADHYKGRIVVFTTSGALYGQATAITAYSLSGGRGRFTVNALTEAVPDNSEFIVV